MLRPGNTCLFFLQNDDLLSGFNLFMVSCLGNYCIDNIAVQREVSAKDHITLIVYLGMQAFYRAAFSAKHIESVTYSGLKRIEIKNAAFGASAKAGQR